MDSGQGSSGQASSGSQMPLEGNSSGNPVPDPNPSVIDPALLVRTDADRLADHLVNSRYTAVRNYLSETDIRFSRPSVHNINYNHEMSRIARYIRINNPNVFYGPSPSSTLVSQELINNIRATRVNVPAAFS